MANFYLDHDVSGDAVSLLGEHGHVAVSSRELGTERLTDEAQLLLAADSDSIFITHNRKDFQLLHDAWLRWTKAWNVTQDHAGILVLEQPLTAARLVELVSGLLETTQSTSGALYDWRPSHGWRRRPDPEPHNRRIREEPVEWVVTEFR